MWREKGETCIYFPSHSQSVTFFYQEWYLVWDIKVPQVLWQSSRIHRQEALWSCPKAGPADIRWVLGSLTVDLVVLILLFILLTLISPRAESQCSSSESPLSGSHLHVQENKADLEQPGHIFGVYTSTGFYTACSFKKGSSSLGTTQFYRRLIRKHMAVSGTMITAKRQKIWKTELPQKINSWHALNSFFYEQLLQDPGTILHVPPPPPGDMSEVQISRVQLQPSCASLWTYVMPYTTS